MSSIAGLWIANGSAQLVVAANTFVRTFISLPRLYQ